MSKIINIVVLLGTARTERKSEQVAQFIVDSIDDIFDEVVQATLYDVRDFVTDRTIPNWQPGEETKKTKEWRTIAKSADAFIMVLPEYNHGYPGEWKMTIDQDGPNYRGKPVLTAGVSKGGFYGARVVEHVLPVYATLGFVYVPYPLYFGNVEEFIQKTDCQKKEQYFESIKNSIEKLLLYEKKLHGINNTLQ